MRFHLSFATFLIALFCVSSSISAQEVSSTTLEQVSYNFFNERLQHSFPDAEKRTIETTALVKKGEQPCYYIVTFSDGYLLISAHRNTFPILGYAYSGSFEYPYQKEGLALWMNQYEEQINYALHNNSVATKKANRWWEKYDVDDFLFDSNNSFLNIEPMLHSQWDQGAYYNQLCPEDPQGTMGHCVTGCVATAMAQLEYYFRWPDNGVGEYSYYHEDYGEISANFGETTYYWNEMANSINEENLAIAELNFHQGVAVDMVYGPDGSGMYNHKAAYALRTYFKYLPETAYVYRDTTFMDWDSLIIAHLEKNTPMYYAGWSVPNIMGHAFIVDGMQEDNYYHFNFGWGGSYDGYFLTEELTPGGSNFNLAQELIINAVPDTISYSYPPQQSEYTLLTPLKGSFNDGSGPLYNYANNSTYSWLIDPQTVEDSVSNITLSFDYFSLSSGDTLSVYDGEDDSSPLLATLSSSSNPDELVSSSNTLFIRFSSNDSETDKGFQIQYKSTLPPWCASVTQFFDNMGNLSDGSGSFNYYNNTTCIWHILPTDADNVTLTFTKFALEEEDEVTLIDFEANELLATYTGYYPPSDLPAPVTSPSGQLFVLFNTNAEGRGDGWDAIYESTVGTSSIVNEQIFTLYPNPANRTVKLTFSEKERNKTLTISDLQGRLLLQKQVETPTININTASIQEGLYLVNYNGQTSKLVVKH